MTAINPISFIMRLNSKGEKSKIILMVHYEPIEDVNKHYGLNLMIYHDYLNINL